MRMPIFFKIVSMSLFFAVLSLALFVAGFAISHGFSLAYFVYVLIIILGISFFVAGSITEPLKKLQAGIESLRDENFVNVKIRTGDEFEELANSFNQMAEELAKQREMLKKSEEKYRSLIEDINDWVFEIDKNLVFTYSSPKVKEILYYNPEEIVGKSIYEFTTEENLKIIKDEFEKIKQEKKAFSGLESIFLKKNGEHVVLEISGRPYFGEDGKLEGYRAVGRDITERKKAEEKLAYLAAIAEHSVDAIVSLDLDGKIVSWNRGAEMMFGYKESEVIGLPLYMLMPRELWSSCRENFKRATLNGYVKDIETTRITKDGRIVHVDQTMTSIYNTNGEHIGFVVIMRDITRRKEAEEELKKAYERLEEKTRELLKSQKELRYLANIVEHSNDAIYSINLEGTITSWNRTAKRIFGWEKNEAIGMSADNLLPEDLREETNFVIQKILEGNKFLSFETRRLNKYGEVIDVDITVSPILDGEGKPSGVSVIARPIPSKTKTEEEMLKKVLKYDIEKGKIYLVQEPNLELAMDVLRDMVNCGYSGVVITRRLQYNGKHHDITYFWISEKKGRNTIPPRICDIESTIVNLPFWNNVVVLELDYLVFKNGFEKVFEFVQRIRETFYILRKGVLILTIDPAFLNEKQIKMLKKECNEIRPKQQTLPHEMYELLRYVYSLNRVGEKPSIKEVVQKFNIARNTCKKRIRYLKDKGLIKITKVGRAKILEVTDRGKEFFIDNI